MSIGADIALYISMVMLCLFAFTTYLKVVRKWSDEPKFFAHLAALIWPIGLPLALTFLTIMGVSYIFETWTDRLAKQIRKDKNDYNY